MMNTIVSSLFGNRREQEEEQETQKKDKKKIDKKDRIHVCVDAPPEYGLRITLQEATSTTSTSSSPQRRKRKQICRLEYVPDQPLEEKIHHPHAFGPSSLGELHVLGGGGSGVTVFEGEDSELGNLVMKHGSYRDTKELFALAKIAQELSERSEMAPEAAQQLEAILPSFRMIYISPKHLWKRPTVGNQLYNVVKKAVDEMNPINIMNNIEKINSNSSGDSSSVEISFSSGVLNLKERIVLPPPSSSVANVNNECNNDDAEDQLLQSSITMTTDDDDPFPSTRSIQSARLPDHPCDTIAEDQPVSTITENEEKKAEVKHIGDTLLSPITSVVGLTKGLLSKLNTTITGGSFGATMGRTESNASSSDSSMEKDLTTHTTYGPGQKLRPIRLVAESNDVDVVKVSSHHINYVSMYLGNETKVLEDSTKSVWYGLPDDGFKCLDALVVELEEVQKQEGWKFTLGQKRIGSAKPKTAAAYLAEGNLEGNLLDTLIDQEIQLIRNLQALTPTSTTEGPPVIDQIREEMDTTMSTLGDDPIGLSNLADEFVGKAIKKNWDPEKGRFHILSNMGINFRKQTLQLMPEEELPAYFLGVVVRKGSQLSDAFVVENEGSKLSVASLETVKFSSWKKLLRNATKLQSAAARNTVWNCGITDGGLHNMFLDSNQIWLFDLGEPSSGQPVSAFLTKFLFSYFHALGMVDNGNDNGGWVNRFEIPSNKNEKLNLTEQSKQLLSKAYCAFKITMDRLIEEVFEGEEEVRGLLISYVTLQLLSDAAFCLDRWTTQGGGRKRNKNHHSHIEKWLWRCLWDIYVAFDILSGTSL